MSPGLADHPKIACTHIVQVGDLGDEVGFGQRQAPGGLLQVHPSADACAGALLDQLGDELVLDVVGLGRLHELELFGHIGVGAHGLQGDVLRGFEQFVVAHQLGVAQAADFVAGVEAVKEHLGEGDALAVAVVVQVGAQVGAVVGPLAPGAGDQVQAGALAGAGKFVFVPSSGEFAPPGLDLGVAHHSLARHFDQRLRQRLRRGAGGYKNRNC